MVSFSTKYPGIKPKIKKRPFQALEKPHIYETYRRMPDGQKKAIWMVDARRHDGTRYRLTCHSKVEAQQKAEAQQALALGQFRLGATLPMSVMVEAGEAHEQGISIREAVEFFKKNRPKSEPVTVLKATEAYVNDRQLQKCESVGQMKALFKRLNLKFGNRWLHELTKDEIEEWLLLQQQPDGWEDLDRLGDERRNTLLKIVRALFTFAAAKSRGWVAADHNPAKEIILITINRPDACTMSPDETKALLGEVEKFPQNLKAAAIPLATARLKSRIGQHAPETPRTGAPPFEVSRTLFDMQLAAGRISWRARE